MDILSAVIFLVVFLYSVILHEVAHGFVAFYFGDDTAKVSGRLSLNPISHIDPVGSLLVPALLFFSHTGLLFGWAKPVPVNPYRLKNGKVAYRYVSLAGVTVNLLLAIAGALVFKLATQNFGLGENNLGVLVFTTLFQINLVLAIFNILPLPGFDGWNFLSTFSPVASLIQMTPLANPVIMAQYGLIISIFLVFLLMPVISQIFYFAVALFSLIFGI